MFHKPSAVKCLLSLHRLSESLNLGNSLKKTTILLLNHLENQHSELLKLKEENQQLKDEINRLKGEKGKPTFLANTNLYKNISSEHRTQENKKWEKQSKKALIKEDNKFICPFEKGQFPEDAKFKGYETVIGQDIVFKRNTTKYLIPIWYSPSMGKTYRPSLPEDYAGYFGNNLRAFCVVMHYAMDITRSKLLSLLNSMGIEMSAGSLQNILIKNNHQWIDEKTTYSRLACKALTCNPILPEQG